MWSDHSGDKNAFERLFIGLKRSETIIAERIIIMIIFNAWMSPVAAIGFPRKLFKENQTIHFIFVVKKMLCLFVSLSVGLLHVSNILEVLF